MTVHTESSVETFSQAGATALAIPYQFFDSSDLRVERTTGGVTATLVEGGDYTVTGGDGETGTVTLTIAIVAGQTVRVSRILPITQTLDLANQGRFRPEAIERQLDRQVMVLQQIADSLSEG